MSAPAKRLGRRRLVRWLLVSGVVWVLLTAGPVLLLRFVDPPTTAFMLRRNWQGRGERGFSLKHQWVPLERISPNLRLAVVAAEDQKFPQHHGFDVEAIEDAIEDRVEGKSSRGASTLSQQVAKNLFLWPDRSFVRKGLEAYFTVLIELCWPKRRILEVHLNVAELGNGIYGAEVASRVYFGKPATTLTLDEAAQLAVMLPSPRSRRPGAFTPKVAERVGWIIDQANRLGLSYVTSL